MKRAPQTVDEWRARLADDIAGMTDDEVELLADFFRRYAAFGIDSFLRGARAPKAAESV